MIAVEGGLDMGTGKIVDLTRTAPARVVAQARPVSKQMSIWEGIRGNS